MNRRQILFGGVAGLIAGYFGWSRYRSPSLPDGVRAATLHLERDVLAPDYARRGGLPFQEIHHRLFEDEDAAGDELEDLEAIAAFVEETAFDGSYLVLVQTGMQSQPDLELSSIARLEDGLRLEVSVDAPWFGVNDDLVTHSLLVRVTDEREGPPETLVVDIDGYV